MSLKATHNHPHLQRETKIKVEKMTLSLSTLSHLEKSKKNRGSGERGIPDETKRTRRTNISPTKANP